MEIIEDSVYIDLFDIFLTFLNFYMYSDIDFTFLHE